MNKRNMHSNKQATDRDNSVMLTILLSKFKVFAGITTCGVG